MHIDVFLIMIGHAWEQLDLFFRDSPAQVKAATCLCTSQKAWLMPFAAMRTLHFSAMPSHGSGDFSHVPAGRGAALSWSCSLEGPNCNKGVY